MLVSEALGDVFGNFEGQNDVESAMHRPPIILSEPTRRPPAPPHSLTAQPMPCIEDLRSFVEASLDLGRAA